MATYKIALKLHQDQAGDEAARANIYINGIKVGDNVEIANTSSQLYIYEVDGIGDPKDGEVDVPIKVELLNDYYVDSANDRNIRWTGVGYHRRRADNNLYWQYANRDDTVGVETPDMTVEAGYNWHCHHTSPVVSEGSDSYAQYSAITGGWYDVVVSANYVELTIHIDQRHLTLA
jgi:hypothetical protein